MTAPIDPTPETPSGTTHALLIGVNDYSSFDASRSSNLLGSRHDVVLLASYCVEVLGMSPENIVVLLSPQMTDEEIRQDESLSWLKDNIPVANQGEAREKEVRARLASLLDSSKGGAALLAFSGHGAALPDGEPVLCLGDTAPVFASGVLSLKTLGEDVENAGANDRLIALFDCCHVGSRSPHRRLQGKALPNASTPESVARRADSFRVSDRVLLAARPGKPAYQVRLGERWHGAFTFALVTAADRWKGENEVSHGSYKHVLRRARHTLRALGVPQRSELRVPDKRLAKIRDQPLLGVKKGDTVKKPDAVGMDAQLQPDWFYTISDDTNTVLAQILVTSSANPYYYQFGTGPVNAGSGGFATGNEFWFLNRSQVSRIGSVIFIKGVPIRNNSNGNPVVMDSGLDQTLAFVSSSTATWQRTPLPVPAGSMVFKCGSPAPRGSTTYILLTVGSEIGNPSEKGFVTVQWYLTGVSSAPTASDPFNPSSDSSYTLQTTLPKDSFFAAASR